MKQIRSIIFKIFFSLITFLLLNETDCFSQAVDFSIDTTKGCTPLTIVHLKNLTVGDIDTMNCTWDLGNGITSTNTDTVVAIYNTADTYTISLSVENGGSVQKTFTLYESPIAGFAADDVDGCSPHGVNFTNTSTAGDGDITSYSWIFGDGGFSSSENPYHNYIKTGTSDISSLDVSLTVTDEYGCTGKTYEEDFITVVKAAVASYSLDPAVACETEATISFDNASTGVDLEFEWDFDDGSSSTETNPEHTFSGGTYQTQLIAVSSYGCSDTANATLNNIPVTASGEIYKGETLVTDGNNVCPGKLNFYSTVAEGVPVKWLFGDGYSSTEDTTSHNYNQGKEYTIKLIAAPGTECADTQTWDITIYTVVADFSMSEVKTCKSPVEIEFTDQSEGVVTRSWDFGDGSEAIDSIVTHTFSISEEVDDEYAYSEEYSFTIELTITNSIGCTAIAQSSLTIQKPTARFQVDTTSGCEGLKVNFEDASIPSVDGITSYLWDFGNGDTITTTKDTISYVYEDAGTYEATVTVYTEKGCADESYPVTIYVGEQITPDFTVTGSADVCPGTDISLVDNSTSSIPIDYWMYTVDNVLLYDDITEPDPVVQFTGDTGFVAIKLQVDINGCISEVVKDDLIRLKGPTAKIDFDFDCSNPLSYDFLSVYSGATSYEWDFNGDAQTGESLTYVFDSSANVPVSLTVSGNGCVHTDNVDLQVRESDKASIVGDTMSCANSPLLFSFSDSYSMDQEMCDENIQVNMSKVFQPYMGYDNSRSYTFTSSGTHEMQLIAKYDNGCSDTAYHTIYINAPNAAFTVDNQYGCAPITPSFTDITTADNYPVVSYYWTFDDGTDTTYTSIVGDGTFSHTFTETGVYEVALNVSDSAGCVGIAKVDIKTGEPKPNYIISPTAACNGDSILFSVDTTNNPIDSLVWYFGDGNYASDSNSEIKYAYTLPITEALQLTVYRFGCATDSIIPKESLDIQSAYADFAISDTMPYCYPAEIVFTHTPDTNYLDSLNSYWDFGKGDGRQGYLSVAKINYFRPGSYYPKLKVQTELGCADSVTKKITITGPDAEFKIEPNKACKDDVITMTVTKLEDVVSYEWDLGDGTLATDSVVTYVYSEGGYIYPQLILYGDSVCDPPISVTDTLYIFDVIASFAVADSMKCAGYEVPFVNKSSEYTSVDWSFGNGETSTHVNPTNVYNAAGTYTVTLTVIHDTANCSNTYEEKIKINDIPDIIVGYDTILCGGGTATLIASGGNSIKWSPADIVANPGDYYTTASPDSTIYITATVKDASTLCKNSDSVHVVVQLPFDLNIFPTTDTTIGVGEYLTLYDNSPDSSNYIYTWNADYTFDCPNCALITVRPIDSTTFILTKTDTNGCYVETGSVFVDVNADYKVRLPSAFTPGESTNNVIYVKGWGIDELIEFRIFNRWGNEVFYTNDINQGWDGTYKDKLQNTDTYTYMVRVRLLNGMELVEKGTFNLLR